MLGKRNDLKENYLLGDTLKLGYELQNRGIESMKGLGLVGHNLLNRLA